jgi:hypothetical protein
MGYRKQLGADMGSRHFWIDGTEFARRAAAEEARLDRAEREADSEQTEIKRYQVLACSGGSFGIYPAADAQAARDACAQGAGYDSEADMIAQIDQPSELVARDVTDILLTIPGHARQVSYGWIWCRHGGHENPWSRGATREDCEHAVLLAVERMGVNDALDIDQD